MACLLEVASVWYCSPSLAIATYFAQDDAVEDYPQEAWDRVAVAVRNRRDILNLTQEEAAELTDGRVSTPNWRVVEAAGRLSYRRPTLLGVCSALEWTPDSIERILRGQEPVIVAPGPTSVDGWSPGLEKRFVSLEGRVERLEEVADRWEARLPPDESPPDRGGQ